MWCIKRSLAVARDERFGNVACEIAIELFADQRAVNREVTREHLKAFDDCRSSADIVRPAIVKRLQMLARDLTVYGTLISEQFNRDLASDVSESFVARYRK